MAALTVSLCTAACVQADSIIQFTATSYTTNESAGFATITVQRLSDLSTTVSVDYATADGTATNGLKYTAASGTLAFGTSETNKTIGMFGKGFPMLSPRHSDFSIVPPNVSVLIPSFFQKAQSPPRSFRNNSVRVEIPVLSRVFEKLLWVDINYFESEDWLRKGLIALLTTVRHVVGVEARRAHLSSHIGNVCRS